MFLALYGLTGYGNGIAEELLPAVPDKEEGDDEPLMGSR